MTIMKRNTENDKKHESGRARQEEGARTYKAVKTMTRYGVEHDLKKSPFTYTVQYDNLNEIEYCFSSDSIKTRFIALRNGFYEETEDSLSNRFKMDFRVSKDLTDVNLYRKVESRGFLIFFNGEEITWQRALKYDGQKLEKMS
jgi:hypothetical protein